MDRKNNFSVAEQNGFKELKPVTPAKIVWHLRNKEIVFRVFKNGETGKYSFRSYRLYKRYGRDRLFCRTKSHLHKSGEHLYTYIENEGSDTREWLNAEESNLNNSEMDLNQNYPIVFKFMLGEEMEELPEGSSYRFFTSDKASRFGKGIEEEFAAYWFDNYAAD
ncbi:MAG: hypothetical protein K6B74_07660 [Ruminococcus sp.]|nr:hypothetical protein [Ruminococcus sp.]